MDFSSSFVAAPGIIILTYWIMEVYKIITKKNEKAMQLIPILCGVFGIFLGIVCYYLFPSAISAADNVFSAATIGLFSGLAATGVNQIFKQLQSGDSSNDTTNT